MRTANFRYFDITEFCVPLAAFHHMKLISPGRLGALSIPNRVLYAPLTRVRASADNVPGPLMA
jgi:hypothetical protein